MGPDRRPGRPTRLAGEGRPDGIGRLPGGGGRLGVAVAVAVPVVEDRRLVRLLGAEPLPGPAVDPRLRVDRRRARPAGRRGVGRGARPAPGPGEDRGQDQREGADGWGGERRQGTLVRWRAGRVRPSLPSYWRHPAWGRDDPAGNQGPIGLWIWVGRAQHAGPKT